MEILDPQSIGRYKVIQRLGAGAMGVVYLCQDPLLKRKVALKIVSNVKSDSEIMLQRFQRESEISAQLNHPNIITVFDVGQDELVGPFITMEFVDGGSLASRLERGPVDANTALDWLTQLGQTLVTAENAGVIHRDIKPENIMLSKEGRLKLMDFGLAKSDESRLTTTGVVMGTPTHTAPELLSGTHPSSVTDRWAYVVTAFQIVTGNELPHKAESLPALLNQISNSPITVPESMPAPMARVFLKALNRDPKRRYDSILAFLEALTDAMGIRDKLNPKGLIPQAPPDENPREGETQALHAATKRPKAAQPLPVKSAQEAGTSEDQPRSEAEASPIPASRLTPPPQSLFKGGQDAQDADPDALAASVVSTPPAPGLPRPSYDGHRSPSRAPIHPSPSKPSSSTYVWAFLILCLGALYYFFLHTWPVRIDSFPEGAEITLDGRNLGPGPVETQVKFGNHIAQVSQEGFKSETRHFRSGESNLAFRLEPSLAWCDLNSQPPGADVLMSGRLMGITPLSGLPVPDTRQILEIKLKGYQTWTGEIGGGKRPPRIVELKPLMNNDQQR